LERARSFVTSFRRPTIYVILDIIAHHTGNVFSYAADRYPTREPA
jgi:hypothetical protein